jgi:hypothetical protein
MYQKRPKNGLGNIKAGRLAIHSKKTLQAVSLSAAIGVTLEARHFDLEFTISH